MEPLQSKNKFKAVRMSDNKWIYGSYVYQYCKDLGHGHYLNVDGDVYQVHHDTVCQATGIMTEFDGEVYEHDILSMYQGSGVHAGKMIDYEIVYEYGMFGFFWEIKNVPCNRFKVEKIEGDKWFKFSTLFSESNIKEHKEYSSYKKHFRIIGNSRST